MEHVTVKATEVETGEAAGSFVALVSTFGPEPDRQGERVVPGAFRRTLERWRTSQQMIPLLSDHVGEVTAVVGRIDPRLSRESSEGLEVSGMIDTSTALGKRVYQLVKDGSLSWSIGYVVPEGGRRRRGKVVEITEVDLAEVSVVATPANRDARTLSIKSAATESLSEADLRAQSMMAVREALSGRTSAGGTRTEEETDALVERSRAEYQARKAEAAEAARQAEEEAMALRRRMVDVPQPRTAIVSLNGKTFQKLAPDAELASAEEIAEREERLAREETQAREINEARAKAFEEAEPEVSICGVRLPARNIRVNGR